MVIRGFCRGSILKGLGFLFRGVCGGVVVWVRDGQVSIGGGGFFVGVVGGGWSQSHREEQNFFLAEAYEFGGFLKRMF